MNKNERPGGIDPASPPAPRISVIIPHYDNVHGLALCLEALERQTFPIHEIIVADNQSPAGLSAVDAAIAGRARLVLAAERGAGPARNGGVRQATGEVLAFTDCDCVPEPDWLRQGIGCLADYDLVGGRMRVLVQDPQAMTAVEAFEAVFAFNNEDYVRRKSFTVTANLMCRRETFDAVGAFGVGVSEDVEWCRRATAMGYRLGYAAHAVVGHPARRTWAELISKSRRTNREGYLLTRARAYGGFIFLGRSLLLPLSILAHAPIVFGTAKLSRIQDRLGAAQILARIRFWRLFDSVKLAFSRIK